MTYTDIERAKFGTAAASKQISSDQQTAWTEIITKVHGLIIEIAESELSSTEGLKLIETDAVIDWLWNQEHPKEEKRIIMTDKRESDIIKAKTRAETDVDDELYTRETH